jgi:orotidine-5'-phosphate decarboxylase
MTSTEPSATARLAERLFVALDVETLDDATRILDTLAGAVSGCKIGSQLFTAAGPAAVEAARKRGFRVFLDLKFHDIPNTVAGAAREAARMGVFMFNVHASGGVAMMRAAASGAADGATAAGAPRPLVLGVTVLTSLDRHALAREVGVEASVEGHVLHLATCARTAGLDGCVASPREIRALRIALGNRFVVVTPGIRPATGGSEDDQVRVATPAMAVRAGADYIVVGRPIIAARDPRAAAEAILAELSTA